jgi:hypothetical protein
VQRLNLADQVRTLLPKDIQGFFAHGIQNAHEACQIQRLALVQLLHKSGKLSRNPPSVFRRCSEFVSESRRPCVPDSADFERFLAPHPAAICKSQPA